MENTVVVTDAIAVAGKIQAGQGIHIAGGQAPQTPVSQTRIPLLLFQLVQIKAHLFYRLTDFVHQLQADQIVHEKATRQEFQGEKIDPFGQGVIL